jgi:uncharacterized membrane protein YdjX (TVP38/TMEM64 family)
MISTIELIIDFFAELMRTVGPAMGFLIIVIESIFPILPLAAFITLNVIVFGPVKGFLISWTATIVGCIISFYICRKGFSDKIYKYIKIDGKTHKLMKRISNMSLSKVVIILALPFTPAFMLNFAAGLSKIPFRKFLIGVILGKISIIYFWGYVGVGLIESIRNPIILFEIFVIMSLVYVLSLLIQKRLNQ